MLQSSRVRLDLWPAVNAAGVLAVVSLTCALFFSWTIQTLDPSVIGDFGMSTDIHWRVTQVTPGAPADLAGIQVGDHIDDVEPVSMRMALGMFSELFALAGERATFVDARGSAGRTVTLTARPSEGLTPGGVVAQGMLEASCIVFVLVGAWLAWVRPTRTTWGVFLLGAASVWGYGPAFLVPRPLALPVLALLQFIVSAGQCAILDFALRFPSGAVTGWRKTVEAFIPYAFALFVLIGFDELFVQAYDLPGASIVPWADGLQYAVIVAICAVGSISLAGTYRASRDLERQRIAWVVLGLICVSISVVLFIVTAFGAIGDSPMTRAVESVIIVFPLAVAYAVIRHRVIDVRFVVSRALVLGIIAFAVGAIVIVLDWAFSKRFANSPAETAVYAGIALIVGLALNSVRQRIGTLVDSVFFRRWQATQTKADAVDAALRRAATRPDLYEPLTDGVASAFSVASVALFERLADGGYLRVAAVGWPRKMLWHILPESPIARGANALRPANVETFVWAEHAVPAGVARPTLVVPIVAFRHPAAILVCGAHDNGTALDPDEIHVIRRLCADAAPLYAQAADFVVSRAKLG